MTLKVFILLLCIFAFVNCKVNYTYFQLLRITPETIQAVELLNQYELKNPYSLSFWTSTKGINYPVDVMVPPQFFQNFNSFLNSASIKYKVVNTNVQQLIDEERGTRNYFFNSSASIGWEDYYDLDEIYAWLQELAQTDERVTLVKGGTSYEGRDILGVHVTFQPNNENRSVMVESNIHACEWIGSAVSTWLLNEFLTSNDSDVRTLADAHNWYFFPIFNVDGFVYTHTQDRLWRKTRVPYDRCVGADPNRNWDYHFNEGGASNLPCSEMYNGPAAFSEPMTKSLSEFIRTIGESLRGYISFHSYSQLLLIPYGYTAYHLDNYDELYDVGLKAVKSLKSVNGTDFRLGNVPELLYVASGGSPDWVKGNFKTRITYTYELRDTGEHGFILPADQIIPSAKEVLASLLTIFQEFDKIEESANFV